jgi:hypothetical protein
VSCQPKGEAGKVQGLVSSVRPPVLGLWFGRAYTSYVALYVVLGGGVPFNVVPRVLVRGWR